MGSPVWRSVLSSPDFSVLVIGFACRARPLSDGKRLQIMPEGSHLLRGKPIFRRLFSELRFAFGSLVMLASRVSSLSESPYTSE